MRYLLLFTFIITATFSFAQKKKKKGGETTPSCQEVMYKTQKTVFDEAIKMNDLDVARYALYQMIAIKPEATGLKDTLAALYFQSQGYMQCLAICNEVIVDSVFNQPMIFFRAMSQQYLGMRKEALNDFETLYQNTKNLEFLYNMASLQYELKRYGECDLALHQIMQSEEAGTKTIEVFTGKVNQTVLMLAAVRNIRGVILMDLNKKEEAKVEFEEALKLSPDFVLAKNNLDLLN